MDRSRFAPGWALVSLLSCTLGLAGCGSEVVLDGDPDAVGSGDGSGDGSVGGDADDPGVEAYGTPCRFLVGSATLQSREGDGEGYAAALYSFEYASRDFDVVRNDGDVLYEGNMFAVNTVVDDTSFIVDLGDVALPLVPTSIDPDEYPTGNWGEHDWVQAVASHTYAVRTIDGNTRQWAAFRVTFLAPGEEVSFDWIRSPDPEALVVPAACFEE